MSGSDDTVPESHICRDCSKVCTSKDKALNCGLCNLWYHAKCQKVSDEKYAMIMEDNDENLGASLQWFCRPGCNKVSDKFTKGLWFLEQKIETVKGDVQEVRGKVEGIESGKFTQAMKEAIKEISTSEVEPSSVQRHEIEKMIEEKSKVDREESEDRNRRSRNVLVFGVKEPKSLDASDRTNEDNATCDRILTDIKSKHKPTQVKRMGNFRKGMNRPLRLMFDKTSDRDSVLQSFKATKTVLEKAKDTSSELKDISMRRDMTPTERAENATLVKELKEKQAQSKNEKDQLAKWIIRKGAVVNVGKYPTEEEEGAKED